MREMMQISPEDKLLIWGDGPWVYEPDEEIFEAHGYPCELIRMRVGYKKLKKDFPDLSVALKGWEETGFPDSPVFGGYLCGYITLPISHPWSSMEKERINADVHGGFTYRESVEEGIQLGFDCAHSGDTVPSMGTTRAQIRKKCIEEFPHLQDSPIFTETYRTWDWAKEHLADIAFQAQVAEKKSRSTKEGDESEK